LGLMTVEWEASGAEMAPKLAQAVRVLGRTLEHHLGTLDGQGLENLTNQERQGSIVTLALLRRELAQGDYAATLEKLDRLLGGLRYMHFLNVEPDTNPTRGHWLRLDIPLGLFHEFAGSQFGANMHSARLCIACRREAGSPQVDATNTRFVLQIELEDDETMQVDVSVVGRRIGARVFVSSEDLRQFVERELPDLKTRLEKLGYSLKTAECQVGQLSGITFLSPVNLWKSYKEVSVEA